jgi:peptidoglycan/LPS O-acetylase OafA/YrhL
MHFRAFFQPLNKPLPRTEPDLINLMDFCKGLGIILVFFNHLWHSGSNFFNVLGWQGVHIFIVLSGFGLTYSLLKRKQNFAWSTWYVKRFERLIPVYWLTCLIGLMLSIGLSLIGHKHITGKVSDAISNFLLELLLLRNFNHETIFDNQGHLWFIPFIISFYLCFPLLYKAILKYNILAVGLIVISIEFLYRALAIYYLDGIPIGHNAALGLDNLARSYMFQEGAAFGNFMPRVGEFMLGMLGAWLLLSNGEKFKKNIFTYRTLIVGCASFTIGNLFRQVLWGWIFTDFFIALGLILLALHAAKFARSSLPVFFFQKISELGVLSYYIFLIHISILEVVRRLESCLYLTGETPRFIGIEIASTFLIIGMTYVASRALAAFDKTKFWRFATHPS